MKNEWNHPQTLKGSFSAVSTATIATKYSFFQVFRDLQDFHTFAPLRSQNFSKNRQVFYGMKKKHFIRVFQWILRFGAFWGDFARMFKWSFQSRDGFSIFAGWRPELRFRELERRPCRRRPPRPPSSTTRAGRTYTSTRPLHPLIPLIYSKKLMNPKQGYKLRKSDIPDIPIRDISYSFKMQIFWKLNEIVQI